MKKIIPFVERLFSLLVVFLMLAATTLWSGKFFGHDWLNPSTEEKGESVKVVAAAPNATEMEALGLTGKQLVPLDSITWMVKEGKNQLGVVMSSAVFAEDYIAYAGTTPLFVYISDDGIVNAVVPGENNETHSFFERATSGILHEWDGLEVDEALEKEVDAVTGATYSSHGLIGNTKAVLSAYAATDMAHDNAPVIGWVRTLALFAVFALGLVASWRYRGVRWLRLVVMVLNVGVTGFWCGQFLSLSILHGWIQNGVDVILYLPTVVMLLIAIVMPYIGKRNHYCMWMCPYGSLQELAWRLPLPKVKIGAKGYKMMAKIRILILMLLLASLWMGWGLSVLDYEPFSAFIVTTAAPAVMVLAAAFVVAGIFVPHPWCQCVCPVGSLLNLAEEKK